MGLFKTSNPALGQNTFSDFARNQYSGDLIDASARMTLSGTVNKTGILLLCTIATSAWIWHSFMQTEDLVLAGPALLLGIFGGFIFSLITIFKKEWAPVTAPVYALLEGLVLGGLSAFFELRYPGIAFQAVALTFGTLFAMLMLYKSGLIKVTDKFRMGVVAATGGIALFYVLRMLLGFFGFRFSILSNSGPVSIVISLIIVGVAALNLVLDFDFVERGVSYGAPKYMEWYAAFGIMVTLVWLYLEMLRLLAKSRRR
jgi:uncharacterized YccA/Bax inhibitor family protein